MKKIFTLLLLCSNYLWALCQETQVGDTAEVHRNKGKFSYAIFKKHKRKVPQNDTMFIKKFYKANKHTSYKLINRQDNGRKYQVHFKGIEVEDFNIDVIGDSNSINTIWHEHPNINLPSVKPLISDSMAIKTAYMKINKKVTPIWNDSFYKYLPKKAKLIITKDDQDSFRLAYIFQMGRISYSIKEMKEYILWRNHYSIRVDAINGEVFKINSEDYYLKNDTGIAYTLYNSIQKINTTYYSDTNKYSLIENRDGTIIHTYNYYIQSNSNYSYSITQKGTNVKDFNLNPNLFIVSQKYNFYDNDNIWTRDEWDNDNKDIVALDAHWGVEKVVDFWKLKFNRNSYDSNKNKILNAIHYNNDRLNARFIIDSPIRQGIILIGDGGNDSINNWTNKPYSSLDILAHEFAHGITFTSSNLFYMGESGALNEGFSDIWGAVIENYYTPYKQKWLIGEEVIGNGRGLRNMQNPKEFKNPAVYKGRYWQTDLVPRKNIDGSDANDFGGVHTNSGVLGYWFYLLTEGGKGYIDDSAHKPYFVVNGIGIDKAAKIAYYTQIKKMGGLTKNATYNDAKDVSLQITKDSFGLNSLEYLAVAKAWYAVGVLDTMPRKYIISPQATKGTIYPKTPIIFNPGDSQTYTLTPNFGYLIDSLYINDSVITPLNLFEYTFKNIQKDYNIKAVFKPKVYTLTTQVYNGNTTLPDSLLVKHDTSIRFGFTTNIPNYTFDYIDINGKIFRDSTMALTYKIIGTTNIKIYFSLQSEPRIVRFNRYLAKRNDTLYIQGRGLQKFLFKKGNYDDSFYITQIISKTKLPNGDTAYSIIIPTNLEEKIYIVYGLNNLNQRSNYYLLRIYGQDCLVPIIWGASNYKDSFLNTQTANLHNIVEMKIGNSNIITLDNLGQPKLIYSTSFKNIILPNNLKDIVKVTISQSDHILLLKSDGTVLGYAYDNIENGVLDFPENLNNVIDISGTNYMSYFLKTNGLVEGYGGKNLFYNIISSSLQTPQNFRDIVEIKSGSLFTLVKFKNNTVNLFGPEPSDPNNWILNISKINCFLDKPNIVNNVKSMDIYYNVSVVQKQDSTFTLWGLNFNTPASRYNNNTIKIKKIAAGYFNVLYITIQDSIKIIPFYNTNEFIDPVLIKLNTIPNSVQNPKEIYGGYTLNGVLQPISIITCIHNDIGGIISPSVFYNSVDPINGNVARITYSASSGYIVDSIFINGVYNANASDSINGYTFTHVNSTQSITVKFKQIKQISKPKKLLLKLFIEGLTVVNTMRPALYNSYTTGSCNTCLDDPQYADSIEVQLRDTINNLIFKTKTLLKVNGDAVVDLDTSVNIGKYYILIKHRSTIETWSANALMFNDSIINYDFSSSRSAAFGNNLKRIYNVYAIYSGHVHTTDQTIDIDDLNLIKNDFRSYAEGYVHTDLNGNGFLDTDDLVIFKFNFINYISAISPFDNE